MNGWGMNGWGMNKETQSIVVALLGGLLLSITLSGRFTSYVRPGFKPLLLIGGGILVIVGVASLILAIRADLTAERSRKAAAPVGGPASGPGVGPEDQPPEDEPPAHEVLADDVLADALGHDHDHTASKAPWLILLPVLVLLLVAPPALGADAVARNASSQGLAGYDVVAQEPAGSKDGAGGSAGGYKFNDGSGSATDSKGSRRTMHFPALEGTDPAMTIKEFVLRALYDADNSVQDTPVTVTGFIAPAGEGYTGGYTIARMVISCCAADANPMQLHIAGDAPLPSNTWVKAVVTVVPDTANLDNGYVPTVTLTSMTTTDQPDDPYEH
jgi:uncharacterized repeat protein (TIGR03943 family)